MSCSMGMAVSRLMVAWKRVLSSAQCSCASVARARSMRATISWSASKSSGVARSAAARAATLSSPSMTVKTSATDSREIGATVAPTCGTISTRPSDCRS